MQSMPKHKSTVYPLPLCAYNDETTPFRLLTGREYSDAMIMTQGLLP